MNPLIEAQAVALLLQHKTGFVHIYSDGSANWSAEAPNPKDWHFAEDVPEGVKVERMSYGQARLVVKTALRRLRSRGVLTADV